MKINCVTVVWGEAYSRFFAQTVLPALLWPGNLPELAGREAAYLILTTPGDAQRIRDYPAFARLCQIVPVEFIDIGHLIAGAKDKYAASAEAHKLAVSRSAAEDAAMLLLSPDCVYSAGSFATALGLLDAGKRVIMSGSLRAAAEDFVPAFAAASARGPLSGRELLGLALAHLHPLSRSLMTSSPVFSRWPSHVYWPVGENGTEGIVAHCFHPHPLLVHPRRANLDFTQAMDSDYLAKACPDIEDFAVIGDSDGLLGIEISARHQFDDQIAANTFHPANVADWARDHANAQHHALFAATIRFHPGEITPAFQAAENLAGQEAQAIASLAAAPGQRHGPCAGPAATRDQDVFAAFIDFSASPYALGDIMTWNVRVCVEAALAGKEVMDVIALTDPEMIGNASQQFITEQSYLRLFLDLFPAFYTNPMLRGFTHLRDRGLFERLMDHAAKDGRAMFPGHKKYAEGLESRIAAYSGHAVINRFFRERGYIPLLSAPPGCLRRAKSLTGSRLPGTFAVTVHVRRRATEAHMFGAALARDGDFGVFTDFFDQALRLYPKTLFLILGKPSEWPRSLLRRDNILVAKTLGLGLLDEMALIQASDLFMGLLSGPSTMAFFSRTPYALFVQPGYERNTAEVAQIEIGARALPFAAPGQTLYWGAPTPETLLDAFAEKLAAWRDRQ